MKDMIPDEASAILKDSVSKPKVKPVSYEIELDSKNYLISLEYDSNGKEEICIYDNADGVISIPTNMVNEICKTLNKLKDEAN